MPHEHDAAADGLDLAADRRRPGRQANVEQALLPLLRGKDDLDAPADPVLRRPARRVRQEWLLGSAIGAALLALGWVLRFLV